MKKRFLGFAAIIAAVLLIVGCAMNIESGIVGTWEDSVTGGTYEFKADGTGQYWLTLLPSVKVPFEWKVDGKKLTWKDKNTGVSLTYDEVIVKGSNMTWKMNGVEVGKLTKK